MTEPITMRDLVEADEYLVGKTFDYAIPQAWFDDVHDKTGEWPRGFVWLYDEQARIWGRPYPLTREATMLLATYKEVTR